LGMIHKEKEEEEKHVGTKEGSTYSKAMVS
jgi:hypothetical protein